MQMTSSRNNNKGLGPLLFNMTNSCYGVRVAMQNALNTLFWEYTGAKCVLWHMLGLLYCVI